jgi:TRAP-type C4-dicarboxylate transport system permease small subunit
MLKILRKIDNYFIKLCNAFLIFTISMMVLMVCWQVICRFLLHISVPYAEEFARLAIVWCILIGGGLAVRSNEHIRVDSLINILPKPVQFILELLSYLLIIFFGYIIARYGWQFIASNEDFTTSLGYSRNVFFIPVVFSGVIMIVYTAVNIVLLFYNHINHTNLSIK